MSWEENTTASSDQLKHSTYSGPIFHSLKKWALKIGTELSVADRGTFRCHGVTDRGGVCSGETGHSFGGSVVPVRGMMMMKQPLLASCLSRGRCWHRDDESGTRYGDMDDWALGCCRLPSSCDTSNCSHRVRERWEIERMIGEDIWNILWGGI